MMKKLVSLTLLIAAIGASFYLIKGRNTEIDADSNTTEVKAQEEVKKDTYKYQLTIK